MDARARWLSSAGTLLLASLLAVDATAGPIAVVTGGGAKRNDCLAQMDASGVAFPTGRAPKGASCADGDACDQDGVRNGVCRFSVSICVNQHGARCAPGKITGLKLRRARGVGDIAALQAALAQLALPTSQTECTAPADVAVPTGGLDAKGQPRKGFLDLRLRARGPGRVDQNRFLLTCVPTTVGGGPGVPSTTSTTTSTTLPPVAGTPGAGLQASILAAAVSPAGVVTVTFQLTDGAGVPIAPTTAATADPAKARVRFTLAHLDVDTSTVEGLTATFTRYRNYVLTTQTSPITHASSMQPTYDTKGTFAAVDAAGTYTYTFATVLPSGFPAAETHTVGAQVERAFGGQTLVANPIFDFVPNGGAVTTTREVATTAECNTCHGRLEAHGGGRREVRLCQLCHTDQAVDPDTGNTIDFKVMIHKIHRGADLPSLAGLITKYSIIGFQQSETIFGQDVQTCVGGPVASMPCTTDMDCQGGTCTGQATTGVGFPRDLRDCQVCHTQGADAANFKQKPSAPACQSCHDDVNPGTANIVVQLQTITAGTNHLPGAQPDALCQVCHTANTPTLPGGAFPEFGIGVLQAHTNPARSLQLQGLKATIVSASGTPGGAVTIGFKITDGAGNAFNKASACALGRIAFAISGPSTDFGGSSVPLLTPSVTLGGSCVLSDPDANGVFTYITSGANLLPVDAMGTWRVGMEVRHSVNVLQPSPNPPIAVNEAAQNPVFDFSVDGSPVVPRRDVVAITNCQKCHGVFSQGFSIHGNLRNQTEYCVICHNPNESDFPTRAPAVAGGASVNDQPIVLKHLIHRIHTGAQQENQPYIVYGFGSTPIDFSEILYPNDRRRCDACHLSGTQLLPLPAGLLPTRLTKVDTSMTPAVETTIGSIPPIQDACLACHDADDARAHAVTMTAPDGTEACNVCHQEGALEPVSAAHAIEP
ncbi:MAG TPA: OmcA/MtrC family decaheme c-type cytochrome [Candidatus Binatia bacterium]|nr:OmcA/MtrC family decaheme c-type cytochrome [Candidatus Binatia bacterium]